MKRKCICELCTCGRHRCPHLPTTIYEKINKPCLITEYVEKFAPYGIIQPRESTDHEKTISGTQAKMESMTTFRADFIPHDILPRPGIVSEEVRQPHGAMNLDTTYKRDFNLHPIHSVTPARPVEQKHGSRAKMLTIPTYKDHYKQWELSKRATMKPEHTFKAPTIKFGNPTTFEDDYSFKIPVPNQSFKPPNAARILDVPFDDKTNYRQDYIPYKQEPPKRRDREQYKPSDEPFDGLTVHRRDFKGQPGELTMPIRPPFIKLNSNQQFYDLTEFRDKYRSWTIDRPLVHKSVEPIVPQGKMHLSTTTQTDFVEHKLQPFVPVRPLQVMSGHNIPFEGQSTMKADYKYWDAARESLIKPREELEKAAGRFDDMTTFRAHYVPHQINLLHSYKPRNSYIPSRIPLDNGTTYQTSYTSRSVEVCPASFAVPPGYEYVETDPRGHKLYQPVNEGECIQPMLANTSLDMISNTPSPQKAASDLKASLPNDAIIAA
ncbi:stabilizer of axonemal microtubules 2-like [Pristis pectinata]|uniref:stabilizer of axonemal microtubules 2-like n=1 Tax=Pristis pectinata TaxID=685728 RepID=UPI00223E2570|nr:stabilizer of axonemal microtubules 2-like [Pristis pectinata]